MATVEEFIATRQQIESVVKQVTLATQRRKAFDSAHKLEQAGELLETLTSMVDNDVQESCVRRLTRELDLLRIRVAALPGSNRAPKKPGA